MISESLKWRLSSGLVTSVSMLMSGYFGWSIMGGNSIFAAAMAIWCATIVWLMLKFAQDAAKAWHSRHFLGFVLSCGALAAAAAFSIVSDYSTASIWRDQVTTDTGNKNTVADNARKSLKEVDKKIANLQAEEAWKTKFLSPASYDAMINKQMQETDRGANVWKRTKGCTDTTLESSRAVCQAIADLKADKANAERRQVVLAELKTLTAQREDLTKLVAKQKKVTNPALAQVRSINAWFVGRESTERTDWWGAKSIMLFLTMLGNCVIIYLGFRVGLLDAKFAQEEAEPARRESRWSSRAIEQDHSRVPKNDAPIPLQAEDAPSSSSTTTSSTVHVYSRGANQKVLDELINEVLAGVQQDRESLARN